MSNPISQLSGRSDLNRPVSRISPRTLQGPAPVAAVSELPAINTVPQASFDPRSMDSLETAFPSLEVITRRILQGMQNAMDRAIEEAAREAIETQRARQASDAERAREAKLDDILAELSRDLPASDVATTATDDGAKAQTGTSAASADLLGQGTDGESGIETSSKTGGESPPVSGSGAPSDASVVGSNSRLAGITGDSQRPAISRESAAAVLGDVVKAVRESPRKDAGQLHRSENLAYSAVLLNA